MSDLAPPIPAATLVLMRRRDSGPPELLMMERTADMAFAAGALVFPGGRIDPEDEEAAGRIGTDEFAAARIAAVRETIEETGIAPAIRPALSSETSRELRARIETGEPFDRLLASLGLTLDADALTLFARWCPNFRETRRFDTLFFLAEAPADAAEPEVNENEAVRAFWTTAEAVLRDIEAKRAKAIFPTRRNLERLAGFDSIEAAKADAARHKVEKITPWIEERGGRRLLCIPDHLGYPVTSEDLETARRT